MKDMQINLNPKAIVAFFRRFHMVIFIVLNVIILSVAVVLLYGIVDKASGADSSPTGGVSTSFDQATIDRINELRTLEEPSQPLNLSQGRISPFNE